MSTHWPADPTKPPHPGNDPDTCPLCEQADIGRAALKTALSPPNTTPDDSLDPTQETSPE